MDKPIIKTNNVPRDLLSGYELTPAERKEVDYLSDEELDDASARFFRYRGNLYDLHEFQGSRGLPVDSILRKWDAYQSDSHFSAVVVRFPKGEYERIIVGLYLS